jgi:MscS family membrane protein
MRSWPLALLLCASPLWAEDGDGESTPWVIAYAPALLKVHGPLDVSWAQWLGLIVAAILGVLGGIVVGGFVRNLLMRLAERTTTDRDDVIVARLSGPIRFICGLVVSWALIAALGLPDKVHDDIVRFLRGALLVSFFWALLRSIDVGAELLRGNIRHGARSLVPLGTRLAKVALVAIAVVAMLSELGYPIASLLAGLGIGGLAVALASQKTFENLFGAFAIGADEPFREGDFVKVDDFVGTVEAVGLRSTKFRTLDRTLISLPNGKLAEMRLESFAARDRLRLACIVGIEYRTTAAQMRAVLAGLEGVLRAHPKLWPDNLIVRFKELAPHSLDIEVMAWFITSEWGEFQLIRQEILLGFMEVVEKAGTSFAFPTRTLHVASLPSPAAPVDQGERVNT